MLKTIVIGNHSSVQGTLVRMLCDSVAQVQVGGRVFTGRLVGS